MTVDATLLERARQRVERDIPRDAAAPVAPELARDWKKLYNGTKSLAQIMRERREELDLTQVDIANAIGIKSSEFIGMVEKGYRSLELNKVPLLADALQIERETLCRVALFEAAPQIAMALFGKNPADFTPGPAKQKPAGIPFKLTQEQIDYHQKIWMLPSPLRVMVLTLIDQFYSLITGVPGRSPKAKRKEE
jgi:transcriptional regulator with XRE-family HTH domain